jgi:hypothetical protein
MSLNNADDTDHNLQNMMTARIETLKWAFEKTSGLFQTPP